jgi:glycopeptide antibiotics resistance protein
MAWRAGKRSELRFERELILAAAFVYLLCVVSATLFPVRLGLGRGYGTFEVNLIPLWHTMKLILRPLWTGAWAAIVPFCVENVLGNLLLFFPLGIFLPLLWKRYEHTAKLLGAAFCFSAGIEATQYLFNYLGSLPMRVCDADDVLLNTAGACLGLLAYRHSRGARISALSKTLERRPKEF